MRNTLRKASSPNTPAVFNKTELQKTPQSISLCSTPKAREILHYKVAAAKCILPLSVEESDFGEKTLRAVASETFSAKDVAEVRFITGCRLELEFEEDEALLKKAIHAAYKGEVSKSSVDAAKEVVPEQVQVKETESTHPIPKLLSSLLDSAVSLSASDVHIEPTTGYYRTRIRVHGMLAEEENLRFTSTVGTQLIRHIKNLCKLDITNKLQALEGGFSYDAFGEAFRMRVSVMPMNDGEKCVIRILENNFLSKFSDSKSAFVKLGISTFQERVLLTFLGASDGSIIVAGPTGSGKSTFLYTALQYVNSSAKNIVTIEDPVERKIAGINQVEINVERGFDFCDALKPLLRQDPDVLMIGEMRDAKTAELALTAGITGHLVLSTVHAGNALEAITRLNQFGVSRELQALSLRLIISQRLVGLNCLHCAVEIIAPACLRRFLCVEEEATFLTSTGCAECQGKKIAGRVGVFEFLPINERVRMHLFSGPQRGGDFIKELKLLAKECGYEPFSLQIRELLLSGKISPETALSTLGISPLIFELG